MERADFSKCEKLLENIDVVSRADLFVLGETIRDDREHHEQVKRDARHEYNIAVDNFNRIKELSDEIKGSLGRGLSFDEIILGDKFRSKYEYENADGKVIPTGTIFEIIDKKESPNDKTQVRYAVSFKYTLDGEEHKINSSLLALQMSKERV